MNDACDCNDPLEPISFNIVAGPVAGCSAIAQQLHIRWMIRRDTDEVMQIEKASFPHPWSEDGLIRCLRQRNAIGLVAEHNDRIVGFMVYELHRNRLHVLNFAVHPNFRRQGVGAAMVAKLKSKLSPQRRVYLMLEIWEKNLPAQKFFASQGFRAIGILRNFYRDWDEDAYSFRYVLGSE